MSPTTPPAASAWCISHSSDRGDRLLAAVFSPLPLWERSDCIADAIRVRGYGLSIDCTPLPNPPPQGGRERTSIAISFAQAQSRGRDAAAVQMAGTVAL